MKALILCAGRGTRLRPLTHTRAKAALPVAGLPVLAHILAYLAQFGLYDVGVVISPDQAELRHLTAPSPGQQVTFIVQGAPLGIAHAVASAADFLGDQPFLLYLGDNLTNEAIGPALQAFGAGTGESAVIAVRPVANPSAFGIAELNGDRVVRVVEKPKNPSGNLAIAGLYLFRPSVLQAISRLTPSARGEFEITDAIATLIGDGLVVRAHPMTGWWQDMGTPDGILSANAHLLDEIGTDIAPDVDLSQAHIQGRVSIGTGVLLANVRLRGPLWIGPGCSLHDAYVGPYTSVGEGSVVTRASVENSILLPGCRLEGPAIHLEDSLLGEGAVVAASSRRQTTLLLGDDVRLQIPRDRR